MAKSSKMRRRDFLKLSAGAAAFSIMSSAGRGAEASVARLASSLARQEQPDKLVFWHMYFDDDANKGRVIKDFANSFESATGIKVELSQIVWTDHVKRMGVVGASQDKIPDVFVSGNNVNGLKGMVAGGYVLPLGDLLTPEDLDQYLPSLIQQCTIEGKLYALPQETQVVALTANGKVLDDLGIEAPTTMDELEAAFEKMLAADITPYGLFLGEGNFVASWLTHILGSRTMTQEQADAIGSGEAAFSDYAMPALETIERWASKGYFGDNPLAMEWGPTEAAQYEGSVGVTGVGGFWPAETKETYHQDDLDYRIWVTPPLVDNPPDQVAGGLWWGVSVNARSDYPAAGARLALTMTGTGFAEQWLRRTFNMAAGKVDIEQITFTPLVEYFNILEKYATFWFSIPAAINDDYESALAALAYGDTDAKGTAAKIDQLFAGS